MGYFKDLKTSYRIVKTSQGWYGLAMKFIDRLKARVQLVITIVIIWALIVLGLAIYIAVKVS